MVGKIILTEGDTLQKEIKFSELNLGSYNADNLPADMEFTFVIGYNRNSITSLAKENVVYAKGG